MPRIYIWPNNKTIEASKTETVLDAALKNEITFTNVCKGKGRCSTCRIMVTEGLSNCSKRTLKEEVIAQKMSFSPNIRLACQTRISDDITIRRLVLDDHDVELTSLYIENDMSEHTGVEKHVFILFADIRGFTSFTEKLLPYDVIHILNRYFRLMGDVITKYGGYIDNYLGDGFMALFEGDDPKDVAIRAIRAGLDMLGVALKNLNDYIRDLWKKEFNIGIGLHYGLVVAGTIGSMDSRRRTVIGDAVNFASRIESANKILNTRFLISGDVYQFVKSQITAKQTIAIEIPGKTGKHQLYEVLQLG